MSFTTIFTILVKNVTTFRNFNGDDIAFIIILKNKRFLEDNNRGMLGLFSSSTNGSMSGQLTIKFDTYKNPLDPDDSQSITSNVTTNMEDHNMYIKFGQAIQVWVHYDGLAKSLQIYANNTSA
ncbi:hypothetical protein SUGI_0645980 [Cryptomeria japonica]|nr:hypothetical protein SUGI_0645980 [Cryptomeria japonica]